MATKDKSLINKNNRNYYLKNKAKFAAFRDHRRIEIKEWVLSYKLLHPCPCGEKHPACLQFHHRDPSLKELEISTVARKQWSQLRLEAEVAKCDVICANCHLKLHHESRVSSSIGRALRS